MSKKVIRLTENDIEKLVKKIIKEDNGEEKHDIIIKCYSERDRSDRLLGVVTVPSSDVDVTVEKFKNEIERFRKGAPFTRSNFRILVDNEVIYNKY